MNSKYFIHAVFHNFSHTRDSVHVPLEVFLVVVEFGTTRLATGVLITGFVESIGQHTRSAEKHTYTGAGKQSAHA